MATELENTQNIVNSSGCLSPFQKTPCMLLVRVSSYYYYNIIINIHILAALSEI